MEETDDLLRKNKKKNRERPPRTMETTAKDIVGWNSIIYATDTGWNGEREREGGRIRM